jgi:hypothetical protein
MYIPIPALQACFDVRALCGRGRGQGVVPGSAALQAAWPDKSKSALTKKAKKANEEDEEGEERVDVRG